MGVPTVTVPGEAVSGRIAASILAGLGIEQWIATGMREYIDIAVRNDPMPAQWVRARTLGSIGCDAQAYARLVEVQLREVWQRWCTTQREAA
jgi:predicted O-linked N-acetylglucosamine transferase (SPINDLY family)